MSPEKQRIAIATVCGFKNIRYTWINANDSIKDWIHEDGIGIPDYLEDLNAMHEAEKILREDVYIHDDMYGFSQQDYFIFALTSIVDKKDAKGFRAFFYEIHATAAQRAEAFLRTLNLWEES